METKEFYYHQSGIRKTMCELCPHKQSVIDKEINELDQSFFFEGHAHLCHMDNRKGIKRSCKGVCTKAKIDGYTLTDEREALQKK